MTGTRIATLVCAVVSSPLAFAGPAAADLIGLGTSIGQGGGPTRLYRIDRETGAATLLVVTAGEGGLCGLSALAGGVYGSNLDMPGPGNMVGLFDLESGAVEFVASQGNLLNVQGLASNETTGVLYAVDTLVRVLMTIAPDGTITDIGSTGPADGRGMAYDDRHGILYAVSLDENLYTIDTSTGASTLVGPTNGPGIDQSGLAYDEIDEVLYLNCGVGRKLYRLDVETGQATLVGDNLVNDSIVGLAWLPPAEVAATMDVRPGTCPNPIDRLGGEVLIPVAIVGSAAIDVALVDLASVFLTRADGAGGAVPPHLAPPPGPILDDVAAPNPGDPCACREGGGDGVPDLILPFRRAVLLAVLELDQLPDGAEVELVLSGALTSGTRFTASDCVRLVPLLPTMAPALGGSAPGG